MNILVTGGAGFIGRWVVKKLLDENHTVTAFDNLSNGRLFNIEEFESNSKFKFIEGDIQDLEKLDEVFKEKYDIIILDPPTFSNSKKTENTLDINRDWPELVKLCCNCLSDKGILYFSTNSRKIRFEEEKLPKGFSAKDITDSTIPEDFRNMKIHQAWKIQRGEESLKESNNFSDRESAVKKVEKTLETEIRY